MSITPIEADDSGGNREQSRDEHPGVRARLQAWVTSVGRRLRNALTLTERRQEPSETETHRSVEIRVGGQRRLSESYESATESDDTDGPPPARGALPEHAGIDAKQEGETLRVYNPQQEGAFIASDTWTDIEE